MLFKKLFGYKEFSRFGKRDYEYDYSHHNKYYNHHHNQHTKNNTLDIKPIGVSVLEKDLEDSTLTYGSNVDTTYCGQISNNCKNDNIYYSSMGISQLKISTTNSDLICAITTGNLAYVKSVLLQIVSIPEVQIALSNGLDAVGSVDVNTLLAQIQASNDITTALGLVSDVLGLGNISLVPTATGMDLIISDTSALEAEGLLNVEVNEDGSYIVTSPLFNHLSVDDIATVTFGYSATNGIDTQSSTVTLEVIGTNDAPIINVINPILTSINENDFAFLSGYENSYYVICEAKIYEALGVTDVDIADRLNISLLTDSSTFTLNGEDVTSNVNGVFQLTQNDIDYFGLTNVKVGDFFVYSTEFNSMGNSDSTIVTFEVSAFDGTTYSNSTKISLTVNGTNDAPMISPVIVSVLEEGLEDITLTYGSDVDTTYHGQLTSSDVDVNDNVIYSSTGIVSVKISTTNTALVTAIATGNLDYVKATLLEIVAIPEVQIALSNSLNAVGSIDVNTLLAQIQASNDIATALGLVSNVLGLGNISLVPTGTGMDLIISDTSALEAEGLLNVEVNSDGSYTVTSPDLSTLYRT